MAGRADLIAELDKVRPPYNVIVLPAAAVSLVPDHAQVLDAQAAQIRATRQVLMDALGGMRGVRAFVTNANFVLLELLERDPSEVFEALKARGILVKNMSTFHPMLAQCLRLTVGSETENSSLIAALNDILI